MDGPDSREDRLATRRSPSHRHAAAPARPLDIIRDAGPEDAAALARVAATTFPLACPPHVTAEAIADFIAEHLSEARFGEYLVDPARRLLLLEAGEEDAADDAVAGYAMVVHGAPSTPDVIAAIGAGRDDRAQQAVRHARTPRQRTRE